MAKGKSQFWMNALKIVLAGTAGWAFYSLINQASEDGLRLLGIENIYAQNGIVVGFVLIIMCVVWRYKPHRALMRVLS